MKKLTINPSKLHGAITVPTSKSHTLRAILFASLADGVSVVRHYLNSPDTEAMISACRAMGAQINQYDDYLEIKGFNGKPQVPDDVINAGNSGQVLRFVGAIAGLCNHFTIITGDDSIRHNRPVKPLLQGLMQLGAFAESARGDQLAPIMVRGPMKADRITMEGQDSQPVSGILIASAFLEGTTRIEVSNPGEKPWVALTLHWFDRLKIRYTNDNYEKYTVTGPTTIKAFDYTVPGDFSSILFPVVAALITQSEITVSPVDMNDIQGDKLTLKALEKMGAEFVVDDKRKTLTVKPCKQLVGKTIAINDFIDSITILAVIGTVAQGETVITGAAIARQKECDRIQAICAELKKMGADIEEREDGLVVRHSTLHGATVNSYHDHRIVMSLAVAALVAKGETVIEDVACVSKSFPRFAELMTGIGMNIKTM